MTGTSDGGCSNNYSRDLADRSALHLVKLIEYTTEQTERFSQMGALQQFRGRCMTVTRGEYSQALFDFSLTFSGFHYPKLIWLLNARRW